MLLLYMAALRTQIYLTSEQRRELDSISERDGSSLAELIREAVDEYLGVRPAHVDTVLEDSFGAIPAASAPPRSEWDKRVGRDG